MNAIHSNEQMIQKINEVLQTKKDAVVNIVNDKLTISVFSLLEKNLRNVKEINFVIRDVKFLPHQSEIAHEFEINPTDVLFNAYDITGVIDKSKYDSYNFLIKELIDQGAYDTPECHDNTLASILKGADAFVGVSAPNLVSKEMVKSMNKDAIIFAMANPNPEIGYEDAKEAGAYIVGSGRSDYPNQINNVLAFPGLFKGALKVKATKINDEMKLAAAHAIASIIPDDELSCDYIVPSAFDKRVVPAVSEAVAKAAIETGVAKKSNSN